jgi:glutamate synthase domain-containing protein 2
MPGEKVTQEIADIRGVPIGRKCVPPPYHRAFTTPRKLIRFVHSLREASGGKPTGFKLCIGQPHQFPGICQAIIETQVYPDFIIVDGGEGDTGAAPLEFEDHVGTPLNEGLHYVHNAMVGCGLRENIKVGCSGKIYSAFEIARRIAQGADYCSAARAMMFALGCIQAQRCHMNRCPVGVATQDPKRVRGLVVEDKAERVVSFQRNTVSALHDLVASLGLDHVQELKPSLLMRRINPTTARSYAQLYDSLEPGELLSSPPADWIDDWQKASADHF